jgi:hypothetical protein
MRDRAHIDVDGVSRIIAIEFKKSKHCGLPLCRRHHGARQRVPDNPTPIPEFGALLSKFSFLHRIDFRVGSCRLRTSAFVAPSQ